MFDPSSGGDPALTHSERSWPVNEAVALATAAVSAIATPVRSSARFPATASQVTRARRFLASFLADSPLADRIVAGTQHWAHTESSDNERHPAASWRSTIVGPLI